MGYNLLTGLIAAGLFLIFGILGGIFIAMGKGENVFFNAIGLIIIGTGTAATLIIFIPFMLGQYLLVIENVGIITSFKKGWKLFRERPWKIIFLMAVIIIGLLVITVPIAFFIKQQIIAMIINGLLAGVSNVFISSSIINFILALSLNHSTFSSPSFSSVINIIIPLVCVARWDKRPLL